MILEEIRLKNFRCFYGDVSIRFSTDPNKNVTLIHAESGLGKTTLLNAFLWCFYGAATKRFEKSDELLNYDAQKSGQTRVSVDVLFEHQGRHYIARRFACANETLPREFVVARFDDGSQTPLPSPDTFINTVIPRDMASHFLFDGEHAEAFIGENNKNAVARAVRDILGCSMIQSAIEDLQFVANQFRKLIPSTPTTTQIEQLNRQLDKLISQIEEMEKNLDQLNETRQQTSRQISDIEVKMRDTTVAKELQQQRDRLSTQLSRVKKRHKELEDESYKWLGENGRFIVSKRITEETFSFLDETEHRGRIPSPYNEEFVKDILEEQRCICGAQLEPGSSASEKVASLLEKAANQVMRDRISKVRARLTSLKAERIKAPGRLVDTQTRLAETMDELATVEEQLAEISEKLKNINLDDVAERERRRGELLNELRKIDQKIGELTANRKSAICEQERLEKAIDELAKQDKHTAIYSHRRRLCECMKNKLEQQLNDEEDGARGVLRADIGRILDTTSHKVFNLKMTDEYVINLMNADGMILPKSSGENQLLGLAFTAALIRFAKTRSNAEDYRLLSGTIAPLVLDSPFGQLDREYRIATAEFIPEMARQVVLLVSSSQGSKSVLNALNERLGAEYLFVRHNTETRGTRKPESRFFGAKEYDTTVFDSEFDGTTIVEINGS